MKLYWRIILVSAISILPVRVIQADVNTGKFEAPGMSKEDPRIGREDEGGKILTSQLAEETNKADAEKKPSAPKAEKKSTSYFKPSSSYSTQPESDPPQ